MLSFLFSLSSSAQTKEFKNAVYVTYGNIIWTDQYSLSYERTVFQKNKLKTKARLVGGKFRLNVSGGPENVNPIQWYGGLMATQLVGPLEIGLGAGMNHIRVTEQFELIPPNTLPPESEPIFKNELTLMANLGLRWEINHFLIRFGLGYPELLYFGVGARF